MSVGEAGRLDTLDAGEMSDEYADTPIDYEAGEPESEEQEDEDAYMSEDDDDEVDELVDEVDESEVVPETNRRSRRAPLRITLKRKNVKETPSRRRSARAPKRTARARQMDDAAPRAADEDEGEEEEDEEMEDDELDGDDSDEVSTMAGEAPMTARQLARANRARGLSTEELVELPMGTFCTLITESSKKKKLSETELALRRSETARRRRNQSERKLEDDKIEVRSPHLPRPSIVYSRSRQARCAARTRATTMAPMRLTIHGNRVI